MAPPLGSKRALPPDPPDAGSRVSKPTPTTSRTKKSTILKSCSFSRTAEALQQSIVLDQQCCATQDTDNELSDNPMVYEEQELPTQSMESTNHNEEFPRLEVPDSQKDKQRNVENTSTLQREESKTPLMERIKGLLDLTSSYLQDMEKEHPGVGADFMAILAESASRAMRGQRVYVSVQNPQKTKSSLTPTTWATKAAGLENGATIPLKKQVLSGTPPSGQSKEDRRVIIRLEPNHEARKTEPFQLRQTIQQLVPDKTL